MIYQYTGQPGHGKTLHALDQAIDERDKGRLVYVCNVRNFDYAKARMLPLSPEQFQDWMTTTPEGAVILVDECYEHEMLPKRAPGSKVPEHVKQLAKHRHTGRDFIFVSQSPSKQMDEFVHDLIERHTHVRRRFGLPFAHLRIFDRYERNPEKAHPLILKRVKLPKRPMGLYESTVLDTTQKKVPWYYPAAIALTVAVAIGTVLVSGRVHSRFDPDAEPIPAVSKAAGNGATATVPGGLAAGKQERKQEPRWASDPLDPQYRNDYGRDHLPRFATMPHTAPIFDDRRPVSEPQLACMSSTPGQNADGEQSGGGCTCLTEQGTRYELTEPECRKLARFGPPYNPYRRPEPQAAGAGGVGGEPPTAMAANAAAPSPGTTITAPQVTGYGDLGPRRIEPANGDH